MNTAPSSYPEMLTCCLALDGVGHDPALAGVGRVDVATDIQLVAVASVNRCTPFRISQAVTSHKSSFNRLREPCAILDFNAMIVNSISEGRQAL